MIATAPPVASATATPNPDLLFARARAALAARAYPRAVGYDVGIETSTGSTHSSRHYRTIFRASTGTITARAISNEESANPIRPHGVSIEFLGMTPGEKPDPLGIPRLAPVYTFGLAPYAPILSTGASATAAVPVDGSTIAPSSEAAAAFPFSIGQSGLLPQTQPIPGASPAANGTETSPSASQGPREIGRISAVLKIYDVSYVGEETVAGELCWHLHLRPLFNPGRYRVRELFIDERNDQTLRIDTDGNFTLKGLGGPWETDFAQVDSHWFITSERASHVGGFDSIAVTFENVHPVSEQEENLAFGFGGSEHAAVVEEP